MSPSNSCHVMKTQQLPMFADSAGSVSLLHLYGWGKLPPSRRVPSRSMDPQGCFWPRWQLRLHPVRLRHPQLHRKESSGAWDASGSHTGVYLYTNTSYISITQDPRPLFNGVLMFLLCSSCRTSTLKFLLRPQMFMPRLMACSVQERPSTSDLQTENNKLLHWIHLC